MLKYVIFVIKVTRVFFCYLVSVYHVAFVRYTH